MRRTLFPGNGIKGFWITGHKSALANLLISTESGLNESRVETLLQRGAKILVPRALATDPTKFPF